LEFGDPEMKGVLISLAESKTGVSDSRPKLLALQMPCLAPCLYVPNKELWKGQKNQAYYKVSDHVRAEAKSTLKPSLVMSGTKLRVLALNRQRIRAGIKGIHN
jgi:hypothetical protein